jgi:hypothetical protein
VPGELVSSLSVERTSSCAAKRKSSSALSLGIIEALSFSVLFSSSLSTPSAVVILLTVTLRFKTLLLSAFGPASYPEFVTRLCSSIQFGIYEISGKNRQNSKPHGVLPIGGKAALDGGVGKRRHKKVWAKPHKR